MSGGESGSRFLFVSGHSRDETCGSLRAELHGVVSKRIVAQGRERSLGRSDITFCQGAKEPIIGHALDCFGIFAANLIAYLMQRSRISLPVQWNYSASDFRFDIIWFNRQRAVQNSFFF